MKLICLDLEGVLVPEIWVAFAEASKIPELKKTTRDEPDYDKLMRWRLSVLKEHGLGLKEIQETIASIDPLPGAKEFLDDLSTRDQRMIFANVTIVHMADTLEQLNTDTETLQAIGLEQACQFSVLRYQQEDGLNTALPYGLRRIKTTRTLTTESTAVLMPRRGRYLLWCQCRKQKPFDLQPKEAAEPTRLCAGCIGQRQVLQHEGGYHLYCPLYQ